MAIPFNDGRSQKTDRIEFYIRLIFLQTVWRATICVMAKSLQLCVTTQPVGLLSETL